MALIEHKKTDDGKYELIISIDPEAFKKAVEKVYRKEVKQLNIPGFRKGKAPRAIIEKKYGAEFFFEDALNEILPDEYDKALEETKIEVIDRPEVDVLEMSADNGAKISMKCVLKPELEVKNYKGIAAVKKVNTVEDADIDRELDAMREKQSRMVSVEDRAAGIGDTANIDFEGFVDDKAFKGGKGENYDLVLGSGQFIPGFEEQIVGHNSGEEFDVMVSFPEDYNAKELAGKPATFKVKLNAVRRKELPELDDEFAKDVSEFDTLDELKKSIKEKLEKSNEEHAASELENTLLDKITDELEGDIPKVMVDDRIADMLRDFDYRLQQQGMDVRTYLKYVGQDIEAFRESFREQAEKQVRSKLALEAIARKEKLEVTAEELEKEYQKYADLYKMEVEKIKQAISEKDLRSDLKLNKAIDVIRDSAKVTVEKIKAGAEKLEEAAKPAKKATKKKAEPKAEDKTEEAK